MTTRVRVAGILLLVLLLAAPAAAERPKPEVFAVIDGDEMFTVLPPGRIPAIDEPRFVRGPEAAAQMKPDEHVIGVVVDGEARAYSTWHLDRHEIVNDRIRGTALAVTW